MNQAAPQPEPTVDNEANVPEQKPAEHGADDFSVEGQGLENNLALSKVLP